MLRSVLLITLLLLIPQTALAQAKRYDACMVLVNQQPGLAYEEALHWQAENGGAPARHCIASALIALGDLQRGAERLQHLGHAPDLTDTALRVQIFEQAGEAFLQLGDSEQAIIAFDAGLALQPQNTELRIGRARALNSQEKTQQALDEFNTILAVTPDHILALSLRATSLIEQNRLDEAGDDVLRAMHLAPSNVDVLLVRGQWREAKRLAAKP